jgi:hypothetical protein
MTDDPRAAISAELTEADPAVPFRVLNHAAAWATDLVPEAQLDDAAAFECVAALDDALLPLRKIFQLIPGLVHAASPGGVVSERLAAYEAELDRQRTALAGERRRLEAVSDLEQQVCQIEAERDELRASIQNLERRRVLAQELPVLRARRAELEAATSEALAADGDEALDGLGNAARRLLELTETQRALLAEKNAQLQQALAAATEEAGRQRARRDEISAELAAQQEEAEQLTVELKQSLPALGARRQADDDVVTGLGSAGLAAGSSGLERVRGELASIAERLANVEEALAPLLQRQSEAYEDARRPVSWSG